MLSAALVLSLAPSPTPRSPPTDYDRAHQRTQVTGMAVLTGWAVSNISTGIAGALLDPTDRRMIHEMNAIWNGVNLALGVAGLWTNTRPHHRGNYAKTRRTYAINNALDVLYIGAGILTAELGRQHGRPRVAGYGKAVVFQGAFLFAFDLAMLLAHERVFVRRTPGALTLRRPRASWGAWGPSAGRRP